MDDIRDNFRNGVRTFGLSCSRFCSQQCVTGECDFVTGACLNSSNKDKDHLNIPLRCHKQMENYILPYCEESKNTTAACDLLENADWCLCIK